VAAQGEGTFRMFGARSAIAGGLAHIGAQVDAIERAIDENPALAFDLAKTLVESACKSILAERRVPFSDGDNMPKLFKAVSRSVPFSPSPENADSNMAKSLRVTLAGLHSALMGICELRNDHGFASHGHADSGERLTAVQALLAAQAADAIVGFLHQAHRGETTAPNARLDFKDNPAFNDFVDEIHEVVRIFDLQYRPSEVLFSIDRDAYRDQLADYRPEATESDVAETEDAARSMSSSGGERRVE
jgi:hypothetical protein